MQNSVSDIQDPASEERQSIEGMLAFNTELTAASMKSVIASHALVRLENAFMCAIEDIHILEGFNPRSKNAALTAHIRSLADSIKEVGFYPDAPLSVFAAVVNKKPIFYVSNGHCRYQGLLLAISEGAQILDVPIVIKGLGASMEDMTVAFARTSEGMRLDPLGLAVSCKRLASYNWSVEKIAPQLGISPEYVTQLLTLAGAPWAIREMVEQGHTTAAVAIGALRAHGEDAAEVLEGALVAAKASGKTKVTTKFMPAQIRKVAMRKAAPKMYEAIQQIKTDPAYVSLPASLQTLINDLVASLDKTEAEAKLQFDAAQQALPLSAD